MFSFDFYTHLRWDVLAPRGPLTGHDVPAPDEVRLKPAVGWLLAGIPRMQAGIRRSARAVAIRLSSGSRPTRTPPSTTPRIPAITIEYPTAAIVAAVRRQLLCPVLSFRAGALAGGAAARAAMAARRAVPMDPPICDAQPFCTPSSSPPEVTALLSTRVKSFSVNLACLNDLAPENA